MWSNLENEEKGFDRILYLKCDHLTFSSLYLTGEKIFLPNMENSENYWK